MTTTFFSFGRISGVALCALLFACSSTSTPGATSVTTDAGADTGPVNNCTNADSHESDDGGACVSSITWKVGNKIAIPRNHHMTWLVDKGPGAVFLYVAGGSDSMSFAVADIQRAVVNDDGTLGAWQTYTPLPVGTIAASVIQTPDEIILVAGSSTVKTWISKIQADGSMGAWTAGPDSTGPWFHATGLLYKGFAYVIGGIDGSTESDQIERATINADGTLTAWQTTGKLPYVLSHHATAINGNTVYVTGGETIDGDARADVLRATIGDDGTISTWVTDTAMPFADETHSAFIHDGSIYVAGGIGGPTDSSLATIARAPLNTDGTIGAWVSDAASKLPHPRSHVHQMPIRGNYIYSVAGAPTGFPSTTGETDMGTFF